MNQPVKEKQVSMYKALQHISLPLSIFFALAAHGQNPLNWGESIGGTGYDQSVSVDVNAAGELLYLGSFDDSMTVVVGGSPQTIESKGLNDYHVSKYDASGNLEWIYNYGGPSNDVQGIQGEALFDNNGNVVVYGKFSGTHDFNVGPGFESHASNGSWDVFITKLDAAGNFLWARTIGGAGNENPYKMDIDTAGNIVICGTSASDSLDLDPTSGNNTVFKTSTGQMGFMVLLDANGNYNWGYTIDGAGSAYSTKDVAFDANGDILLTGTFTDQIELALNGVGSNLITALDGTDTYFGKYDLSGAHLTGFGLGASDVHRIAADQSGNFVMLGNYTGSGFDADPGTSAAMYPAPPASIGPGYIIKYNSLGNYLWSASITPSISQFFFNGIDIAPTGDILCTGLYQDSITIETNSGMHTQSGNGTSSSTSFLMKLTGSGLHIWDHTNDECPESWGTDVAFKNNSEFSWCGHFDDTIDIDLTGTAPFGLNSQIGSGLTGAILQDAFIGMYGTICENADQPTVSATNTVVCSNEPVSISVDFGDLGDAQDWYWYSDSCGGVLIDSGEVFQQIFTISDSIFVRGEGGCTSPGLCVGIAITVLDHDFSSDTATICEGDSILIGSTYHYSSGVYHDSLQNMVGCDSILETRLGVIPSPVVFNTNTGDTACLDEGSVSLLATPSGGTFGGTAVTGSSFDPLSAGLGSHELTYTYDDGSGCIFVETFLITVDACTAINEGLHSNYKIFPNPASESIQLSGLMANEPVRIFSASGKLVDVVVSAGDVVSVNLTNLAPGLYMVKIDASVLRFVKL